MSTYHITAYCPRRKQTFTWITGKRGEEKLVELIKKEGLIKIKVEAKKKELLELSK